MELEIISDNYYAQYAKEMIQRQIIYYICNSKGKLELQELYFSIHANNSNRKIINSYVKQISFKNYPPLTIDLSKDIFKFGKYISLFGGGIIISSLLYNIVVKKSNFFFVWHNKIMACGVLTLIVGLVVIKGSYF